MRTLLAVLALACTAQAAPKTIEPLWSKAVGPDAGSLALVPAGDQVLTVTWDGALVALDATTGKTRWRKTPPVAADIDRVQIAVDGDVVVAAWPKKAELVGYDVAKGTVRWTRTLGAAPTSVQDCPAHHATVITHREGGTLMASAFEPATGRPLWRTKADGPLIGAGAGHVFAGVPSGTGRLLSGVQSLSCATGTALSVLPFPDRPYMGWLAAGEGQVVTHHFAFGFKNERICVTNLADQQRRTCIEGTDGSTPVYPVAGATLTDGHLLWSTRHMMAANLDQRPDSWLFALDLKRGEVAWRSAPLRAGMAALPAGEQLLTGYGSTGADDFAYVLDPASGKAWAQVKLAKQPNVLAADAERGYVATYDGRVLAFALPKPGPQPVARAAVTPQPISAQPAAPNLGWQVLTTLDAHPKKARTSGSMREGTADPAVFLDAAGERVLVGGNDDRVRVMDLRTGKRVWRSKKLGKDVEHVQACQDGTFSARIYGGKTTFFAPKGKKWRRKGKRLDHGFGWMSGLAESCTYYVAHTFDDTVDWYRPGKKKNVASVSAVGRMDKRGMRVRANRIVVPNRGTLQVIDVNDLQEGPAVLHALPTPDRKHDGQLVQAWMVDHDTLLTEYCGATRCVVELISVPGNTVEKTLTFDTRGAGWAPTVPSNLDVSADGRSLFFFRLGLGGTLVDVERDQRQPVAEITGQVGYEYLHGAFNADGSRLVLSMHPKPHQITVLSR